MSGSESEAAGAPPLRPFAVFGFASTHDALVAESVLRDAGIEQRVIPTPSEMGSLCGIALRVPVRAEHAAEQALQVAACAWNARMTIQDR